MQLRESTIDWAYESMNSTSFLGTRFLVTGYEIKLNMADETKVRLLESKIAVARRELNKLRSDMHSIKKMFVHKFKEVKEMVETGEVPFTFFRNTSIAGTWSNSQCIIKGSIVRSLIEFNPCKVCVNWKNHKNNSYWDNKVCSLFYKSLIRYSLSVIETTVGMYLLYPDPPEIELGGRVLLINLLSNIIIIIRIRISWAELNITSYWFFHCFINFY